MDTETPLHETLLERERKCPHFLTYTERPKFIEKIHTTSDFSPDGGKDQAILLSGPMVYEDHFTRDTIRLYRRHYPEVLIILSTWDDEDHEYLDDLRDGQVHIIINPKSENTGNNNTEPERDTFHAALEAAKRHGITYVLRTATAQRIYAPNALSFLQHFARTFPLNHKATQKQRIIASSYLTYKYLPFCICAMFMYGHIDDLLMYWDYIPPTSISPIEAVETLRLCTKTHPACYIARRYLNNIGETFNLESIQDHWRILAERFCLFDREMLDIYWHMPSASPPHATQRREYSYILNNARSMTFSDWLILYHTQGHHPPAPEWVLDMPWGEIMKDKPAVA